MVTEIWHHCFEVETVRGVAQNGRQERDIETDKWRERERDITQEYVRTRGEEREQGRTTKGAKTEHGENVREEEEEEDMGEERKQEKGDDRRGSE